MKIRGGEYPRCFKCKGTGKHKLQHDEICDWCQGYGSRALWLRQKLKHQAGSSDRKNRLNTATEKE